jgi:hypothetical protein
MPKIRPIPETGAVQHLIAAYGLPIEIAQAVDAYLECGTEIAAAEHLNITVAELDRRLAGNEMAQRAMADEVKHRFNQGAVIGWRTIMELAQGGPAAVKLAAAKLLVERAHGKEASRLDIHVHRDEGELLVRIAELTKKLGLGSGPVIDAVAIELPPLILGKADQNRANIASDPRYQGPTLDVAAIDAAIPEPWEMVDGA